MGHVGGGVEWGGSLQGWGGVGGSCSVGVGVGQVGGEVGCVI